MSAPKQVIILRKDLNMRKGKMVAQGAHASMAVILKYIYSGYHNDKDVELIPMAMRDWIEGQFTKICVSVNSLEELLDVYAKAKAAGIPCSLIRDAGHTEFKEPTYTAVAIGPDYPEVIDPITKELPLL